MKTLKEMGEDEVVRQLVRLLPRLPKSVLKGPGDDCAVVSEKGNIATNRLKLLKTDVVVEGVHFLPGENMIRVGSKALNRAVSDIGAMGGVPEFALITLLAEPLTPWSKVRDLYRGISRAAKRVGVAVVGGETGRTTGPLVCNVSLTGWVESKKCVLRSGGRPGDVLLVTGRLGGSLKSGKHLNFVPRLKEAAWLVEHFCPNAMMDLSDGLATDGQRLAEASGCEMVLDEGSVPRTRGCSVEEALGDGEDFELLLAVSPRKVAALEAAWRKMFPRLALTRVGSLQKRAGSLTARATNLSQVHGYDHFQ